MTEIPSGPANRRLAQELYEARVEEQARVAATNREAWLGWLLGIEIRRLQALRAQIASLKRNGGDDATDQLTRLGKEHFEHTGADGGALGTRPSLADRMREARQAAGIETPEPIEDGQDVRQQRRQRL